MGKIRVKVLGDEEAEKKQKKDSEKRAEAKSAKEAAGSPVDTSASNTDESSDDAAPEAKKKVVVKKDAKGKSHSAKYASVAQLVDVEKVYKLDEALTLLPKLSISKFDETVELHINTVDKGISGQMTLPHGTGKKARVVIVNPSDDA